eukprot:768276-Hanusia_phi.AAC.2
MIERTRNDEGENGSRGEKKRMGKKKTSQYTGDGEVIVLPRVPIAPSCSTQSHARRFYPRPCALTSEF